jgi:hypothetical protein
MHSWSGKQFALIEPFCDLLVKKSAMAKTYYNYILFPDFRLAGYPAKSVPYQVHPYLFFVCPECEQ